MYVLKIPNFNLRQIYESCQDINILVKQGFEREGFFFFRGEEMIKVEQHDDRILFSCNDEQLYDIWFDFFDLSTDYSLLNKAVLDVRSSGTISNSAKCSDGVHLLAQDPFECIVKEMLFTRCSPSKAKERLESVKEATTEERGKTLKGFGYTRWRPIPNVDQLKGGLELLDWFCDTETSLICKSIIEWSEGHRMLLDTSKSHSKDEARTELLKLVNDEHKVNRILAYGFGFHDVSCVSPKQSMKIESETEVDIETIIDFELSKWKHKQAYVGTILARDQVMKMKNKGKVRCHGNCQ